MIPKVIHYCWFSNDPFPPKIQRCIASWKKYLPDYEIKQWDFNRFPKGKSHWVDNAFDVGKYAFAADYIRAYALYTEGGIYLDSDVEILKSFDELLGYPYFIGKESEGPIEAAVMGAEEKHNLFRLLLDYYNKEDFIFRDGTLNDIPMPNIINQLIESHYSKVEVTEPNQIKQEQNTIYILPSDYFSPKSFITNKIRLTPNTYCIHHFSGSWISEDARKFFRIEALRRRLNTVFGNRGYKFLRKIYKIFRQSLK